MKLLEACRQVGQAALKRRFICGSKLEDFADNLRKEYYRQYKRDSKETRHGNSKLSTYEEDLLIGISLGMTRSGRSMGAKEIRQLAADIFPGQTFGKKW